MASVIIFAKQSVYYNFIFVLEPTFALISFLSELLRSYLWTTLFYDFHY